MLQIISEQYIIDTKYYPTGKRIIHDLSSNKDVPDFKSVLNILEQGKCLCAISIPKILAMRSSCFMNKNIMLIAIISILYNHRQ